MLRFLQKEAGALIPALLTTKSSMSILFATALETSVRTDCLVGWL